MKQLTNEKWLNLVETEHLGHRWVYATRNKDIHAKPKCNAVGIAALVGDKLTLIKEYRPALKNVIISIPAGLIDEGELPAETVRRELKEETGLDLVDITDWSPNIASSAGLTDELVQVCFCTAKGELSAEFLEKGEDITVFLADYQMVYDLMNSDTIMGGKCYAACLQFLAQQGFKTWA